MPLHVDRNRAAHKLFGHVIDIARMAFGSRHSREGARAAIRFPTRLAAADNSVAPMLDYGVVGSQRPVQAATGENPLFATLPAIACNWCNACNSESSACNQSCRLQALQALQGFSRGVRCARAVAPLRMARVRQEAVRRTAGRPRLSRALHPSRRDLEFASHIRLDDKGVTFRCKDYRVRSKAPAKPDQVDDAGGRQVHPPLSPACAAQRLPPRPPLWPIRRRGSGPQQRVRPPLARRAKAPARAPARQGRRDRQTPSPAHRCPVAAAEWSSSKRSNARAPRDRPRLAGSGSTPHDHRYASRCPTAAVRVRRPLVRDSSRRS